MDESLDVVQLRVKFGGAVHGGVQDPDQHRLTLVGAVLLEGDGRDGQGQQQCTAGDQGAEQADNGGRRCLPVTANPPLNPTKKAVGFGDGRLVAQPAPDVLGEGVDVGIALLWTWVGRLVDDGCQCTVHAL